MTRRTANEKEGERRSEETWALGPKREGKTGTEQDRTARTTEWGWEMTRERSNRPRG